MRDFRALVVSPVQELLQKVKMSGPADGGGSIPNTKSVDYINAKSRKEKGLLTFCNKF
jgi:hypothetical protein